MRYLGIAVVALAAAGCQDELTKYDTGKKGDIYFEYAGITASTQDSMFTAVLQYGQRLPEKVIEIPVSVMGKVVDYEREMAVASVLRTDLDNIAIPGTDYVIERSVVPAGSVKGTVRIKLLRTSKLDAAGEKGLHLEVFLLPNDNFDTDYFAVSSSALLNPTSEAPMKGESPAKYYSMDARKYKVNYNNASESSILWNATATSATAAKYMIQYYGSEATVNAEWIKVFSEHSGLPLEYWYPDPGENDYYMKVREVCTAYQDNVLVDFTDTAKYPISSVWGYYVQAVMTGMVNGNFAPLRSINRYLKRYEEENGHKLTDSNGAVIELPTGSQVYQ